MSAAETNSLNALAALHTAPPTTLFSGVTPPGLVNLGVGAPSDDCLPVDLASLAFKQSWHGSAVAEGNGTSTSTNAELSKHDFLQYGPQLGHSVVLDSLAAFLDRNYKAIYGAGSGERQPFKSVSPDRLALTAGASQSLFNLACLLLKKDAVILMEDPTYFLAWASLGELLGGFEAYGVRQKPGRGIDVGELERTLKGLKERDGDKGYGKEKFDPARDRFPYLLYANVTYNNPTGSTLDEAGRRKIVELAYEYGVLVVTDDVYDLLSYDVPASDPNFAQPQRIAAYDNGNGRVVSNGSFSKLFGPGIRLGWTESTPTLAKRLQSSGLLASGGAPQQLLASLLLPLLQPSGILESHLVAVRKTYGSRLQSLLSALEQEGLAKFLVKPPRYGGFFVFLQLPVASLDVRRKGIENGVGVSPGEWFSPLPIFPGGEPLGYLGGDEKSSCVRLAFTFYKAETLVEGIKRLGKTVRELQGN